MIKTIFKTLFLARQKGTVLILAFSVLSILLILGSYFLVFTLTDLKISNSQEAGTKAYYLAEAGVSQAIWKLKNDDVISDGDDAWKLDFIDPNKNPYPDGTHWQATFSNNFGDGSYTVTIKNSGQGRGEIISIATLPIFGGKSAQRIVKTTVFKALAGVTENSGILSGGTSENIDIMFTSLKVNDGNLFSNHNLDIKGFSQVRVYDDPNTEELEGKTLVAGNYKKSSDSQITSQAICAKNTCTGECSEYPPQQGGCPPDSISVPLVDFDSSSPNSFKSRAQEAQDLGQCEVLCNGILCSNQCIYSKTEFEDILWQTGQGKVLTLNNVVTYVTGDIDLRGGRSIVVNGALVADDNIYIGQSYSWTRRGKTESGFSQITVNRPFEDMPSGILTKRKINFGLYSSFQQINVTGVIYANDEITIISLPTTFNVVGGIIGRKLSLIGLWQWLNIFLNNDIIIYGLGYKIGDEVINPDVSFSPVITVEHWEESY